MAWPLYTPEEVVGPIAGRGAIEEIKYLFLSKKKKHFLGHLASP
jgi:hypothetical protein